MLREKDAAFVAGLVDSSAYMTIKKVNGLPWTPQVAISAKVGVKGMAIIRDNFGGYMNRGRLIMSSGGIYKMLDEIYPFLLDAKGHADVLLEFRDSITRFHRYKIGKPPTTEMPVGEKDIREELWERMRSLNMNGTDPGIVQE